MILQCKFVFLMTNFIGKEYIMKVSTKGRYALRLMLDLAAVSYTHLDVYKRQEHVDLQHLYIDGSKFEANANKYSWVWKKATEKSRYLSLIHI